MTKPAIADMVESSSCCPKDLFPPRLENSEEELNRTWCGTRPTGSTGMSRPS